MRGILPKKIIEQINNQIPRLDDRCFLATHSSIKCDMIDLEKSTLFHVALVSISDACHRFNHARVSVFEALANQIWYRDFSDKKQDDKEITAIACSKYYFDYASLLLYATGEDIASFIINFLNIERELSEYIKNNQSTFEDKNISSKSAKVGIFLHNVYPDDNITHQIHILHVNNDWREAIEYRNRWVHEKPPIIKDYGIQENRKSRIKTNGSNKIITFGGGSPHDYSIDELQTILLQATTSLAICINGIIEIVIQKREKMGEKFDFNANRISCGNIW